MAVTQRVMRGLSPARLFAVLRDGTSYDRWVVGTRAIRSVDDGWPREGTRLHFTVGYGPLRKDDQTRALDYQPDRLLVLEAHGWPAGTARVEIHAEPVSDGVLVGIVEHPERGLAKLLHNPVLDALIKLRNVETLRRLDSLAREFRP